MRKNYLAKNLCHLRKINHLTQDKMGKIICKAKNTVSSYESGRNEPDTQTLDIYANYFCKTVDELINTDLTSLNDLPVTLEESQIFDIFLKMFPLTYTDKAYNNKYFKKGYNSAKRLVERLKKEKVVKSSLDDILEIFLEAQKFKECTYESSSNILWCIFFWWMHIGDTQKMLELQAKITNRYPIKKLVDLRINESADIKNVKNNYINHYEELIYMCIKILKTNNQWKDLGDYFLALKYVVGLENNELSYEMNSSIGIQLMTSYFRLGNIYAIDFIQCYDIT